MQRLELKSLRTTNPRILAVYGNDRTRANIEYTMPAATQMITESPIVTNNPQIRRVVTENLRTIITPDMYSNFPPELQQQATVMASPYECGRVLEADKTVTIDGKEHVVNFKGVGATTIARNGSVAYRGYMDMTHNLRLYPFYDGYGELADYAAENELEGVNELVGRGLDTEKILGIYEITELADINGDYLPPSVLRASGIFRSHPVILARASRSNFRLLDSVTMYDRRQRSSIPALREFVLEQFSQQEGVNSPDLNSYLRFLVGKIVGQEIPLIAEGYEMCSGGPAWQNLARNISTLGEELDLEAVGKSKRMDLDYTIFDYTGHIASQIGNIDASIRAMGDTLSYEGPQADFEHLADSFWLSIKNALGKLNLAEVLDGLPDHIKGKLGIKSEDKLLSLIFKGITRIYKDSIFGSYYVPAKEGSLVYQSRMMTNIKTEGQGLGVN